MPKPATKKFRAKLGGGTQGDIPLVRIPFDVKQAFGKARAPIVVTVNGFQFRSTVAVYGGNSYVGFRRDYREAADIKLGQTLTVTLALDDAPREVSVPADLAAALKKTPAAAARWAQLSYSHRKEHVQALEGAKKAQTRARRLGLTLAMLCAPKRKAG